MSIWPSSPHRSAMTPPVRPPRRSHLGRRVVVAAATVATMVAVLVPTPASAATVTVGLTATVAPGNPAVAFNATVAGSSSTDTAYVCFGDEAPALCDATHAGTAVIMAAATTTGGATFSHSYTAEATYQAVLYEVAAGAATVTPSPTVAVTVTIDATARLSSTAIGLTATLDGGTSTAAAGDTWWACFGDKATACTATAPDASGTVTAATGTLPATGPLPKVAHTYAKPGIYPASLTITGPFSASTATLLVTVNYPDPTAVLSADSSSGTGNLPVIFDGSKSVAGSADSWAFCFGNVSTCTAATPDAAGQITAATPTVALPTTAHNYSPGNYTATLWVSKGGTTSSATVAIAVGNPVAAPDGTCTMTGIIRTCDLFAKGNGNVTAGSGASASVVPFWGFTTSDGATPVLGGPKLVATEGEKLAFTVHNELDPRAGNVSITVPSLAGAPDLTGVAPGATGASGTFTLTRPGTYIYEAGLTSGGERQVAMGLSGLLIVRPSVTSSVNSARCAYDSLVSTTDCVALHDPRNYFDREKVVVANELDANFNANPFGSDTGDYHPTNFFLDGVAYDPAKTALDPTDPTFSAAVNNVRFDAAPGETVLMRYADLGLREHSLNLTNLLQTETARDANLLPGANVQNTEFLNAGQTADTYVTIPAGAVTGTKYPLYDAGLHLNNGAVGGLGGMYAFVNVVNGATAADVGPVGSAATATPTFDATTPNIDNGTVPTVTVTSTFTAQPPASGPTPGITSVQWELDGVPGPTGLWNPSGVTPAPGTTASVSFQVSSTLLSQLLGTEPDRVFGDHTIWLQATDAKGKPGPAIGASFALAMRDPVISTLSINPQVTNGSTVSNQFPVASTKISVLSNFQPVPQSSINVNSTSGFPAKCDTGGCKITVGMTIADGPAQGQIDYATFSYAALTPTSFTGVQPLSPVAANTYELRTGNTVALDVVPAGYIGLNATATASLPGWVVQGAQACVLYASGATPGPADKVDSKCTPTNKKVVFALNVNNTAPLVAVDGFLPPPTLPDGVRNAGKFWVMVRAQEGPDGTPCTTPGACRWSPWLYYHPVSTTVTRTRPLAEDNVFVTSTAGFPARGQLTAVNTASQPVTVSYQGVNPTTFLTNNGGAVPGTLAAGAVVTGSAGGASTYQTLTLVKAGPTTGAVTVSPNPNNGFGAASGNLGLFDSFNVQATAASRWANIALAEAFVAPTSRAWTAPVPILRRCIVKPNTPAGCVVFGQGAEMTSADGLWGNSLTKDVTAFLPLSELQGMPDGLVRVWVHAKDIAGNWGPFRATDLVLDRTAPAVDSATNTAPAVTTTAAAAVPLPLVAGSLAVASAAGFPTAGGSLAVTTSTGVQVFTYTGVTANTLTGVTGGTTGSTLAQGAAVTAFTGTVSVTAHDAYSTAANPPDITGTNGVSSGVAGAEWFTGADPGPGKATKAVTVPAILPTAVNTASPLTFTITALPAGKTVYVRVVDAAGNWSSTMAVLL